MGFVKIKADCRLVDGTTQHEHRLPGICFLRGNAVAILLALFCDDGKTYSLLVEQPRYVHEYDVCKPMRVGCMIERFLRFVQSPGGPCFNAGAACRHD